MASSASTTYRGSLPHDWRWESPALYSRAATADISARAIRPSLFQDALRRSDATAYNPFGYMFKVAGNAVVPDQPYRNPASVLASFVQPWCRDGFSSIASIDAVAFGPASVWAHPVALALGTEFRCSYCDLADRASQLSIARAQPVTAGISAVPSLAGGYASTFARATPPPALTRARDGPPNRGGNRPPAHLSRPARLASSDACSFPPMASSSAQASSRRRSLRQHPIFHRPPRSRRNELGWHWAFVALGLVLLLGAYFWYTSARIIEQPIAVNYGPTDRTFAASTGPLLGAEFTGGNAVQLLVNGDQFFPPMLDAIRHAEKTITLETYIWTPGKISDEFIDALTERARHGVKVHVLLDGMGTLKFHGEDRDRLASGGVEVVTYGRQHWWEIKPNINHRTHRKILVVDGRIGFTGGMCVDDKWLGHADSKNVWRDTQVRVEGPAVREMQAVFASNWLQTTGRVLLGESYFPEFRRVGDVAAQCFRSGPGEGAQFARMSYLLAIASARHTIDIEHAYFVPDDLAIHELIAARQRGVRVRVIVPAINDSRFGRAASRSRWRELLVAGVEFYRYQPAMLHAKTMSVDDAFVTVGSINFDNRSFSINDEVALNVIDADLARAHRRVFENDLSRSKRYTLAEHDARPFYIKFADKFCGLFRSQL